MSVVHINLGENVSFGREPVSGLPSHGPKKGSPLHYPVFVFLITAAQIITYIFSSSDESVINSFCYSPRNRAELWRLVTYTFLHINGYHLVCNLLMMYLVGATFEMEHGFWMTATMYITGGVTGALGCDFFDRTRRMIGASGSCSSLLMAQLAHLLLNWKDLKHWGYRLLVISSFAVSDILSWPLSCYLVYYQNLSSSSHLSAGLNGLLLGILILNSKYSSRLAGPRCFLSALYGIMLIILIIVYVPFVSDTVYRHAKRYDNYTQIL